MATHLVIDGYNLLGARGQVGSTAAGSSEFAREQLLRELGEYRQRKGHAITVVFDGWREGHGTEQHEHRSGVEVVYSRRGERADQVIQRLAEEFRQACAVVSSDREVANFARAQGALVMEAREFDLKLHARAPGLHRTNPAQKDLAGDDLLPRRPDKKGNPRKLPKALRKRNRQLKGF